MSIRLNKIGNISEAVPYTANSAVGFTGPNGAYHEMSTTNTVEPYYGPSTLGAAFSGYSGGLIGPSGSTISYCGSGASYFRENKGDYFLAAFNLSSLFDQERDTPSLIGLHMHCNAITATTFKLPQIYPMVIWANRSSAVHKTIATYCMLAPSFVARFSEGVSNNVVTVNNTFEISDVVNGQRKDVFVGYFVGRSSHNDSETVEFGSRYTFKDLSIGVTAASLKGNRPVFDPVMV